MRVLAVITALMMLAATGASAQGPRALSEWMLSGGGAAMAVGNLGENGLAVAVRGPHGPRVVQLDARLRPVDDFTLPGSDAWTRALATPPGAVALMAGPAEPPEHERGIAVWRLQLGADGHLKQDWLRRFRRTALDSGAGAVALDDGGMVVVGRTGQEGGWVLRLDAAGDPAWRRLAPPVATDGLFEARAVTVAAGGDVLVAAYGAPSPLEPGGVWVLRFDGAGSDRGQLVIDEAEDEHPEALSAFADGGLAVAGWTLAVAEGVRAPQQERQAWLARVGADGHLAWDHRWPGGSGGLTAVAGLDDGGVLVAGQVAGAALLARLDSAGETVWEWRRQGAALNGLVVTPDGSAVAVGERRGRPWGVRFGY